MGHPRPRSVRPSTRRFRPPTAKAGATDTRVLFPQSKTGNLNAVQQLGGISLDTGIPSDLQGCFVGSGNAGASTYWWDAADSAVVGSPPRIFTQDYYDIKPQNCTVYWMAAAFCAWDGGRLPTAADYQTVWSSDYPWGTGSRNYQDLGGYTAFSKVSDTTAITAWTIDNLNDYSGGFFYYYPKSGDATNANPQTGPLGFNSILDTTDEQTGRLNLADFTPYIAAPGRFIPDVSSLKATGVYTGDGWQDLAANLFEYRSIPVGNFATQNNNFCDTSAGVLNTGSGTTNCDSTQGEPCTRANYQGKQLCGYVRGSGSASAPVSIMPTVGWEGGSWEVHAIAKGGLGSNQPMHTQYGKAGFRCVRPTE